MRTQHLLLCNSMFAAKGFSRIQNTSKGFCTRIMIVDTVPVGQPFEAPVVAGRIGPETATDSAPASPDEAATAVQSAEAAAEGPEGTAPEAEVSVDAAEDKQLQEEIFWAELKLLGELSTAEDVRMEAEDKLKNAEDREKDLKVALDDVRGKIPDLRSDVDEARTAVLAISRDIHTLVREKKLPTRATAAGVADADASVAAEAAPAVDPDAWRKLSTAELLKGVPRLGETKLAMIIEVAPTVGDLEDLRRQASEKHKQFKEVLPKGCGQGVADAIEDRLIDHIAKDAKQAATASGKPQTGLADELVTSLRTEAVEQAWRPADCELDEVDTDLTRQGFAAYRDGKPYTDLPTLDPQLAHQWMVGWVSAEVIAAHATSPASQVPASSNSEAN